MKEYTENRIARESLISMLGSILDNLENIQDDQKRSLVKFNNKVDGKQFIIVSDGFFMDKKTRVNMNSELFFEIVNHNGWNSKIHDHINSYKKMQAHIKPRFDYYNALINTTFHISFDEFSRYESIANDTLNYKIVDFEKLLEQRFGDVKIDMTFPHEYV